MYITEINMCIAHAGALPSKAFLILKAHVALLHTQHCLTTIGSLSAGMLYYGNKYWGITEANYLLVLLHCGTGYFGPHIWRANVTSHISSFLDIKIPVTLTVVDCFLMGIACFAVSYSAAAFYRVLKDEKV